MEGKLERSSVHWKHVKGRNDKHGDRKSREKNEKVTAAIGKKHSM